MFERDGYDVTIHVPITFSQAVLGDDVEVPTVDGRIVQHIPEGTQSGTKFRLRGQGIQYLNGRGRGDQYVIVDVEIPKKVTRAQREALKAFEDSMKEDNYEKRKGFFRTCATVSRNAITCPRLVMQTGVFLYQLIIAISRPLYVIFT